MLDSNLKEYDTLRTELEKLRDCLTSYVGYALGGSGAALFGLAAAVATQAAKAPIAAASICFAFLLI